MYPLPAARAKLFTYSYLVKPNVSSIYIYINYAKKYYNRNRKSRRRLNTEEIECSSNIESTRVRSSALKKKETEMLYLLKLWRMRAKFSLRLDFCGKDDNDDGKIPRIANSMK